MPISGHEQSRATRMKIHNFQIGEKVKVISPGLCESMIGTVIDCDACTIDVRFDQITDEMKDYQDGRKGILTFLPKELIIQK